MILNFVSNLGVFNCEVKSDKLETKTLAMILRDIDGIVKPDVSGITESVIKKWVDNLEMGIMVISPKNLNYGIHIKNK